jgi:serine/threonine protein kinase/Flp pilus assembly protein TadD
MSDCPPDDQLRQLLSGQLPAEAVEPLTRHADACAACQSRLEQLSADTSMNRWRGLLRPADPGEPTKALDPALQARTRPAAFSDPPVNESLLRRLQAGRRRPAPPAPPGYEVLGELGHGGMGVVYKARQTALKRLVALKVIATGTWARPEEVARFRAEAEAVAQLQHPNIVQIYEIGEHDGRPFFSLEYVEGGSLAHRLGGTPLPPPQAAELVRTLALAMHAAHQRGIVHRDLKPANILLGNREQGTGNREESRSSLFPVPCSLFPKIADFGLAKRLDGDSHLTQTGQVVGTPSYMAPEQALGQVRAIGPLADVYALGAILYECLTGRPPFNAASHLETLQQVQWQSPVAPARLQPQVPRDLETICLKCLQKEPHRRYASAQALADDLECFLAGRPILARPASVRERALKWAKRRPAVAALLAALAVALLILIGGGIWSYVRVSQEANKAKKRSRIAQGVIDDMYTKVAEEWLADEPEKDPLQKEFLRKALDNFQELAAEDDRDPAIRRETALAHFRMGQLHRTLGQDQEAAAAYRQAIDVQEQLADRFPDEPRYRQDLANSYNWLGELLRARETSLKEAEQNYRKALALQESLVQQFPEKMEYRRELARTCSNLGLVEMDTKRLAEAGQDYNRAVDLLEDLVRDSPTNAEFAFELARTRTNRGVFHRARNEFPEAERDYSRAIDLLTTLRRTSRARTAYAYSLALAYQDRGNLRIRQGRKDEARSDLSQAEVILTRLVEDFPARPRYRKLLAGNYNSLGSVLVAGGRSGKKAAEDSWHKARRLLTDLVHDDPDVADYRAELGVCLGNLGWLQLDRGDLPEARSSLEEAIRHLQAALKSNPERIDYQKALRNQYRTQAETLVQSEDAAGALRAATALAGVFPERAQGYYLAACFVARCVPVLGKDPAAARCAEQAAALLQQALDKGLEGRERSPDDERYFRPLAERPEFADLVKALKARPRP